MKKGLDYTASRAYMEIVSGLSNQAKRNEEHPELLFALAQNLQHGLQGDRSIPCHTELENIMRVVVALLSSSNEEPPNLNYVIEKLNMSRDGLVAHCLRMAKEPASA